MEKTNDWNDVEDILYCGTKEEIENLLCPDCGGKIQYRYSGKVMSFEVRCKRCGYISRAFGSQYPKCVDYFGSNYDWGNDEFED